MWKRTAQLGGELWRRGLDLWEVRTVGIAEVLDVEEGRTGSNQAGVLGLGMVVPVPEPGGGLLTWMAAAACWPAGWIPEYVEERGGACVGW